MVPGAELPTGDRFLFIPLPCCRRHLTYTPQGYIIITKTTYPHRVYIREVHMSSKKDTKPCCCRKKMRSDEEIKDLITRLNRIEGQVRGIRKMVEEDAYCVDVLTQVNAARCSLNSFSKVVLKSHIKSCVEEDVRNGSEEKIDELVELLQKMMK